ncbi:MAG: LysM peptidoglycan-binding domain-containing protein [Ignavibacteria bacterium]|jgi:membrane-bound lytic murein transglycosylase D|nr:LysM peptidoglycan-binding domain-containing protein [Ignavibacteria bacterium]
MINQYKQRILLPHNLLILLLIPILFLAFSGIDNLYAQNNPPPRQQPKRQAKFPDKYTPLDNSHAVRVITDEMISNTIEKSRQSYIKGLIVLQKNDTTAALSFFEAALTTLNKIGSYPEVDDNDDYKELFQNIMSDIELCSKGKPYSPDFLIVPKSQFYKQEDQVNDIIPSKTGDSVANAEEFSRPPSADTTSRYVFKIPSITELQIPVEEHAAIDFQIDFLTKGRAKNYMPKWIERSSRWFPMMKDIAEKEGIPSEILLLTFCESSLDPYAESSKHAVGLWQFMYPTGIDYGLNKKRSIWVDERRDPVKSTRAALRYLRDLYLEFNDWYLALSAYNWGWGNVRRALKQTNKDNPTFWDISNQKNINMPPEARNYVPLFIAILKITSDPPAYGIDVKNLNYLPEFKFDIVELEQAVNLSAVSKSIGVGVEEIRELNPELLYDITPPDRKYYRLRVPPNTSKDFKVNFAKLSKEEKQPSLVHKVTRGENIVSVAEKFDVSIDELISLNGFSQHSIALDFNSEIRIPIGVKTFQQSTFAVSNNALVSKAKIAESNDNFYLVDSTTTIYELASRTKVSASDLRNWNSIPVDQDTIEEGKVLIVTKAEFDKNNKSVTTTPTTTTNVSKPSPKPSTPATAADATPTKHTVEKGETLFKIAKDYGLTEAQLRELNPNIKGDNIRIGEKINVAANAKNNKDTKPKSNADKSVVHTVKQGDNLSEIAQKYQTTVSAIVKLNGNLKPDKLSLGQKIRVK